MKYWRGEIQIVRQLMVFLGTQANADRALTNAVKKKLCCCVILRTVCAVCVPGT